MSDERRQRDLVDENPSAHSDERMKIPTLKYFWQASPLAANNSNSIHHFLRSIKVFNNFSDFELKIFCNFLHERIFASDEIIIEEGDTGFGFYLVFNGNLEIYTKSKQLVDGRVEEGQQFVISLGKHEYFGELALLESQNKRNATVISKGSSTLLAIYKPDIAELIERHPVIGAKFLQGIALIVAMRFNRVTNEIRVLKTKVKELESKLESTKV